MVEHYPTFDDAYMLAGFLFEEQSRKEEAIKVYQKALKRGNLSQENYSRIQSKLYILNQK